MIRIPMFGFFLLAFLLLAVVLAVAVFLAFRSGEQGKTKLSGFAGCAIAFALLVISGVGAIGIAIVALVSIPSEALRHGPVRSLEFRFSDEAGAPGAPDRGDIRLRLELRGVDDDGRVLKWLRQRVGEDARISTSDEVGVDRQQTRVIEVRMPLSEDAREGLQELRRNLEEHIHGLNLPDGGRIEFRGPE